MEMFSETVIKQGDPPTNLFSGQLLLRSLNNNNNKLKFNNTAFKIKLILSSV